MSSTQIHVPVPPDDVQRERIEHRVFQQLARLRAADVYSIAPAAPQRPKRKPLTWYLVGAAALAVVALVAFWVRRSHEPPTADSLALVQTPVGGSSRFTIGDSVIDAGSDTSVSVQRGEQGVTLSLAQGSVDCEVVKQRGQVFRVVAGEVVVEVVGTRFSVSRVGAGARVDVTRGKVRVRSRTEERLLTAGESWTPSTSTSDDDAVEGTDVDGVETGQDETAAPPSAADSTPTPRAKEARHRGETQLTRREAFSAAQALEASSPRRAAAAYRKIADGKDAWAAVALYSLAELQTVRDADAALRTIDELARRFPTSANLEDAAWLRAATLRDAGRRAEASRVAADYLRTYPRGTYAKAAARLMEVR